MSSAKNTVRLQLRRVIGKFKFEELEEAVLPSFPELTWKKLKSSLVKHHLNFTVSAALQLIEQTIKDAEIGDKDLTDRLSTLQLMDVSRHSKRRVWTCHELRGVRTQSGFQSIREIQESISKEFLTNIHRMDIRVTSHDNITYVMVKAPKSRRKSSATVYPTFFAFSNGQKYFFASRQSVAKDYLISMTQALGYNDNKLAKLSGRDLKSLIELLRAKQQAAISNENILNPPEFTGLKPVVRNTGIDFTGAKQREEYVDKCFGIDPPSTELLQLTYVNQTWKCTELVPEAGDEVLDVKWEFRSHYIPNMIKELAQRRVMRVPLPLYAQNMLTIGKNEMMIRQ